MGVSLSQQQVFVANWSPYATQAGLALGISPSTILSQWGLESGYGTNATAAANNNVAGIMMPGTQNLQAYPTQAAFEQSYVNTIAGNFPGAENTGADITAFVQGLTANPNKLYTTTPAATYTASLAGVLSNLTSAANVTPQSVPAVTTSNTGGSAGGGAVTGGAASASPCSGLSGAFTWACWQNVVTDLAFVFIGVLIFIVAVASGLFGSKSAITGHSH